MSSDTAGTETPSTLLAPAKLTLSLRVTGVRDDGYHLIDAEMVALDLYDELTITPGAAGLELIDEGANVGSDLGDDNLVSKALALVDRQAHVRLLKRIPARAGLGGGSADAAAVLRWADYGDLVGAAGLGADVAFCLVGGRARVTGIGEIVEPRPFVSETFTLLTPPVGCSTPEVYRRWDDLGGPMGAGGNDLEPAALSVVPELGRWRDELGNATGEEPRLAGSGSTWFVSGHHPGPGRRLVRTVAANP